ncbi:MAG: 3'-5' exoribonuclease [Chloroflexota bacterium]|nr:3'-5' exoribonuclease [Chloroflexota bacterium]
MRYFLDTEFIDRGRMIDLISLGVVAEDGREFYRVSRDFDAAAASDWVREHVLPRLESHDSGVWMTGAAIRGGLRAFVGDDDDPTFWTWGGGAYDWFAVIGLFGGGDHLPDGWPYVTNDLDQWLHQMGLTSDDPRLPEHAGVPHHALADARHSALVYDFLVKYQREWICHQARALGCPD